MATTPFRVVLDTCVLFPQNLTNVLLSIADAGLFSPVWSADILTELQRNLVEKAGLTEVAARHRLDQMQRAFPHASATGYEHFLSALTNDPKDRHVLAAAVRTGAAQIVTANLNDFPPTALSGYDIEAIHPDEFLLNQLDLDEERTLAAVDAMLARNLRPPTDRHDLSLTLRTQAPRFCAELAMLTGRPMIDGGG
ncbi:putative toxin-antitoxin system toxin component, PIN family [Tsukamurella sp. 1534]|uniref:PIN domain-containing protein n=1 Tax=Tsukamurella sp. 1534 TaxID=1151061 RepID=UPI0003158445|nr:PIN domain-containing protein [Tsukamurella sp. 1534]